MREGREIEPEDAELFVPPRFASPTAEWAFEVWVELGTDRQHGMGGAGPIPAGSIDRFADRNRLTSEEEEELRFLVRRADEAYLDWLTERLEAKGAK